MKTNLILLLALSLAALSGCATAARRQAAVTASQSGAPAALVSKMQQGDRLALTDLETLARSQVSDDTVLAYLRETGATYELTTAQIDQLREAGVTVRVIDYLLATPTRAARRDRGGFRGNFWLHGHGFAGHRVHSGYGGHGRGRRH
jgi:hypothetical protein